MVQHESWMLDVWQVRREDCRILHPILIPSCLQMLRSQRPGNCDGHQMRGLDTRMMIDDRRWSPGNRWDWARGRGPVASNSQHSQQTGWRVDRGVESEYHVSSDSGSTNNSVIHPSFPENVKYGSNSIKLLKHYRQPVQSNNESQSLNSFVYG